MNNFLYRRLKHLGTTVFEYFIRFLGPLFELCCVLFDVSNGYFICKELGKCEFGQKSIFTNTSVDARRYQLVTSSAMCSHFVYSNVIKYGTHFMGTKAYTTGVFGKSFFALRLWLRVDHLLYCFQISGCCMKYKKLQY